MCPQTAYNIEPPIAVPGMPFSPASSNVVESRPALVFVPFGVAVELVVSGGIEYVQPLQDSGTGGSFTPAFYGVSIFDPAREQALPSLGVNPGGVAGPAGYAAGEMVPVMRSGTVHVQTDGEASSWAATWPSLGQVRVWHSSTGASQSFGPAQGVFTMLAVSTTAGAEIDPLPTSCLGRDPSRVQSYTNGFGATFNTALVELNLPGTT
jgi:hypothetical protein